VSVNILLVGSTDRQLETVLRACGMTAPSASGSELAALAQPAAKQPDVLVLDLQDQTHLPAALPLLKRQHPATGVIIVTTKLDPALLLEAMRAGVTEVVSRITEEDLRAAIDRLGALRPGAAGGRAYAFVGAKGGVGSTPVAVNVATALAKIEPGKVLFIDLHVANGDAAVFFGVEPRFSIIDALENTNRLDEAFFRNLIVRAKSGVDLLASSDRVMLTPVDVRRIRTLLEFAEKQYRHIVLDVPRSDAAVLDALETAARIVVVANQELATVRSASRIAAAMRQRYGKDKVSVVVSRADRLADIGHEDVERAVGSSVEHSFPSDYRRALQALNKGTPVTVDNHNELAGSFSKFARALAGIEKAPAGTKKPAARFSLFGTRKGKGSTEESTS
jgi:pilus assembly protein CpaE